VIIKNYFIVTASYPFIVGIMVALPIFSELGVTLPVSNMS